MVFPQQRMVVAYAGQDLGPLQREADREGWILRRVPLELASCDPARLARWEFEVVRRTISITCPG